MDDRMDIYMNVERPSGHPSRTERDRKMSENIYGNLLIHTLGPNRSERALSGVEVVKKSSCRAAAVVLGLLCLLLLTGLITSVGLFTKGSFERETEMVLLQTSNTNLTEERDQLQTSNTNLTEERDQLQTSNTNLAEERDQLQTSNTNMAKERDQLQTSNTNMAKERDQLQTSNTNLADERDQLLKKVEALSKSQTEKVCKQKTPPVIPGKKSRGQ